MKFEMRIGDAARYLQVEVSTLRTWALDDLIRYHRSEAGQLIFFVHDLDKTRIRAKKYPGLTFRHAISAYLSHNQTRKTCRGQCSQFTKKHLSFTDNEWYIHLGGTLSEAITYCPICGKLLKGRK